MELKLINTVHVVECVRIQLDAVELEVRSFTTKEDAVKFVEYINNNVEGFRARYEGEEPIYEIEKGENK